MDRLKCPMYNVGRLPLEIVRMVNLRVNYRAINPVIYLNVCPSYRIGPTQGPRKFLTTVGFESTTSGSEFPRGWVFLRGNFLLTSSEFGRNGYKGFAASHRALVWACLDVHSSVAGVVWWWSPALKYINACCLVAEVCRPDWSYFGGVCYSTSTICKTWAEAQRTCYSHQANLVRIRNQEENVYVQHRLNGAKGWIGLTDLRTEGTFKWADNQPVNFTYWAKNQPNNFRNEDCVHTLGVRHGFMWNDVDCNSCHNYTCSEG